MSEFSHYKIVIDTLNDQESYGTQHFVCHIFFCGKGYNEKVLI